MTYMISGAGGVVFSLEAVTACRGAYIGILKHSPSPKIFSEFAFSPDSPKLHASKMHAMVF